MSGYIKLHRKLLDWEWYSDINAARIFLHCLLKANYQDKRWHGIEIKRGSFITTIDTLAKETGLSKQQTRTALYKLKSTHEITHQATRNYSLLIIEKYNDYQDKENEDNTRNNTPTNTPVTHDQHTGNTPVTRTKEYKEYKERKESNYSLLPLESDNQTTTEKK